MLIYICSPYTPKENNEASDDMQNKLSGEIYAYYRDQNIERANEAGKQILSKGHTPLIPHNNTAGWEDDERFNKIDRKNWIEHCLILLSKCDGILMCPGWMESSGCTEELQYFIKNFSRFVFYDISEVPSR